MKLQKINKKSHIALALIVLFGPFVTAVALWIKINTLYHWSFFAITSISIFTYFILLFFLNRRLVNINGKYLNIRTTFYRYSLNISEISELKIARKDEESLIGIRINGIGLPGYRSGWFKVKNAQGKIFVDVSSSDFVQVYVKNNPAVALGFVDNKKAVDILKNFKEVQ